MLENEIRSNRETILRAAQNLEAKRKRAGVVKHRRLKGAERPYDHRNIEELAALLIKEQGETEEERAAYFDAEVERMIDAFEGQSDIKPYIKAMYDSIAIDENIDWSNPEQVERIFATIKVTQALATVFKNFKKETLEIYSTHADMKHVDARIEKAGLLYQRVSEVLVNTDMRMPLENMLQLGYNERGGLITNITLVQKDASADVYEADLKGETTVTVDPLRSENSKKFFLDHKIALQEDDGTPFTNEDYSMTYIRSLALSGRETTFEQALNTHTFKGDPERDFGYDNLLFINGKSFFDLSKELDRFKPRGDALAGQKLREALTDGKSVVTLLRSTYTLDGRIKFYHQDIKLDLDKLNEVDRKETHYNFFRRWLDRIGVWKIQRFPTNKARDERIAKIRNDAKFNDAIRKTEEQFINLYNSHKPDPDDLGMTIPRMTREQGNAEQQRQAQTAEKSVEREKQIIAELANEAENLSVEPQVDRDKTLSNNETMTK